MHGAVTPQLTNKSFVPFDTTPGVFDNDIFKRHLAGQCNAFFQQYAISFAKLIGQTSSPLLPSMTLTVAVHANLLAEGTTDSDGNPIFASKTVTGTQPTGKTTGSTTGNSASTPGERLIWVLTAWLAAFFVIKYRLIV
eukprot:jgi/Hompol1/3761/HPOL_003355-RA